MLSLNVFIKSVSIENITREGIIAAVKCYDIEPGYLNHLMKLVAERPLDDERAVYVRKIISTH